MLPLAQAGRVILLSTSSALRATLQKQRMVVGLHAKLAPTDIEEGMRVAMHPRDYAIALPLPPKIDPRWVPRAVLAAACW